LPKDVSASSLNDEVLSVLLSYPRSLGKHPETGEDVVVALGKFGAYPSCGAKKANVGEWRKGAALTLDEAVAILAQPARSRSGPEALKSFGTVDGLQGEVRLMSGRYGPYVTDGKTNATLPKGVAPESVTLEQAVDLIKAKAALGPVKKRRFVRRKG